MLEFAGEDPMSPTGWLLGASRRCTNGNGGGRNASTSQNSNQDFGVEGFSGQQ